MVLQLVLLTCGGFNWLITRRHLGIKTPETAALPKQMPTRCLEPPGKH
jgi:hypothetical protein